MKRPHRLTDSASLLRQFLGSPAVIGAVVPSSRALAEVVTSPVPDRGDPVVVELGAGTGTITDVAQHRLGGRGRHIAVELNSRLATLLRERHPTVDVLHAAAEELPGIMDDRGLTADVVISALPWAAFRACGPDTLHSRLSGVMAGTAAFTQIAYTATRWAPPARQELADLRAEFQEVTLSRTVWRNLPPALVYLARRPRRPHGDARS